MSLSTPTAIWYRFSLSSCSGGVVNCSPTAKPQLNWWGLPLILLGCALRVAAAYLYFDWLDAASLAPCLLGVALLLGGRTGPALVLAGDRLSLLHDPAPVPRRNRLRVAPAIHRHLRQHLRPANARPAGRRGGEHHRADPRPHRRGRGVQRAQHADDVLRPGDGGRPVHRPAVDRQGRGGSQRRPHRRRRQRGPDHGHGAGPGVDQPGGRPLPVSRPRRMAHDAAGARDPVGRAAARLLPARHADRAQPPSASRAPFRPRPLPPRRPSPPAGGKRSPPAAPRRCRGPSRTPGPARRDLDPLLLYPE